MKKYLISLILTLILTIGCTATQQQLTQNTVSLAVMVSALDTSYTKVNYLVKLKQKEANIFSDAEWGDLLDVDASVELLMLKYQAIVKLDLNNMKLSEINLLWDITKSAYNKARNVIITHMYQFDSSSQFMFTSFDSQAQIASKEITKLLEDPTAENIQKTVSLVVDVLSLAVKIVSIAVI